MRKYQYVLLLVLILAIALFFLWGRDLQNSAVISNLPARMNAESGTVLVSVVKLPTQQSWNNFNSQTPTTLFALPRGQEQIVELANYEEHYSIQICNESPGNGDIVVNYRLSYSSPTYSGGEIRQVLNARQACHRAPPVIINSRLEIKSPGPDNSGRSVQTISLTGKDWGDFNPKDPYIAVRYVPNDARELSHVKVVYLKPGDRQNIRAGSNALSISWNLKDLAVEAGYLDRDISQTWTGSGYYRFETDVPLQVYR